jgi:hypothetical protein
MAGGGTLVATATVPAAGCDGLGVGALWELAGAGVAEAGTRCADAVVVDTGTMCADAAVVDAGTTRAEAGCAEVAGGVLCFDAIGAAISVDWVGARLRAAAGAGVACTAGVAAIAAGALCAG